jgi:hypothetical protein
MSPEFTVPKLGRLKVGLKAKTKFPPPVVPVILSERLSPITRLPAGYVTNISLSPADQETAAFPLEEERIVVLVKVLGEVNVPTPTSQFVPSVAV